MCMRHIVVESAVYANYSYPISDMWKKNTFTNNNRMKQTYEFWLCERVFDFFFYFSVDGINESVLATYTKNLP